MPLIRGLPQYRRAVGFLALPALLFYMLAAIAALPGVPGIFIETIQTDLGTGSLEVRVGYFGTCLRRTGSDADIKLQCSTTHKGFSDILIESSNSTSNATEKLLVFASGMQRDVFVGSPSFFPGAGLLFLISVLLLIPLEIATRPPARLTPKTVLFLNHAIIMLFWFTAAWSFAGALSIVEVVRSQQELLTLDGSNNITVKVGVAVQFLQWTAFIFTFVFASGVTTLKMTHEPRLLNPDEMAAKAGPLGGQVQWRDSV
ncbi:hypothetical protein BOTNAR_0131g00120 [Botryotinia narcissicola]|uniref:MARVEL domain-containing protein n=1 Tax=Botryotinia narcissicola TaxID=278944 RepID=A0A4Z1IIR5_9HELO|nr:hypothetical protein BOTNAR_0131g00120 [Botryotinia narcissicola]